MRGNSFRAIEFVKQQKGIVKNYRLYEPLLVPKKPR